MKIELFLNDDNIRVIDSDNLDPNPYDWLFETYMQDYVTNEDNEERADLPSIKFSIIEEATEEEIIKLAATYSIRAMYPQYTDKKGCIQLYNVIKAEAAEYEHSAKMHNREYKEKPPEEVWTNKIAACLWLLQNNNEYDPFNDGRAFMWWRWRKLSEVPIVQLGERKRILEKGW